MDEKYIVDVDDVLDEGHVRYDLLDGLAYGRQPACAEVAADEDVVAWTVGV